ncbi:MAG: L-serine ammonia-lyase, iron-sulfur-dependent, subunit alpha [Bacteroidales bacterium]|nr:L-serine ammonia-lyase, iron-sulfur-dependent, subunit alpha [Bacteroidales bacterium]
MDKSDCCYQSYLAILKEELVPAMGCTEPICLAYAAAKAREVLGSMPKRVEIKASGNIIKNVKSVIVPNTKGMKGLKASVAAGIVAGNPDKALEVIAEVTPEQKQQIVKFLDDTLMTIVPLNVIAQLDVTVTLYDGNQSASVRIAGHHTNIVKIEKNEEVLFDTGYEADANAKLTDRKCLCMKKIYDFANTVDIEELKPIICPQMECNKAIAMEGLKNNWGANVGSTILRVGNDIRQKAKAWAAAGSDARMSGCEMPVIINSGSGNQGMTVSLPILAFAEEFHIDEDRTIRAVALSNLVAIHQKTGIGRLSAYCGAVSAGCASGCGIAYLLGHSFEIIEHTLENALGMAAGIVCDGAKPSCAGKIALAVEAGLLGFEMSKNGNNLLGGDGIIGKDVEETIDHIGCLGRYGMKETDVEILKIMVE